MQSLFCNPAIKIKFKTGAAESLYRLNEPVTRPRIRPVCNLSLNLITHSNPFHNPRRMAEGQHVKPDYVLMSYDLLRPAFTPPAMIL